MIRVLLVDDSPLIRSILRDIFLATPDITVAGEAANGREAVELTEKLRPDLIVTDIMMPLMDGLTAIEEIMAAFPTPILVLSGSLEEAEVDLAFAAIKKGALDVMTKPDTVHDGAFRLFAAAIVEKVRLLSRIKVIHHHRRRKVSESGGDIPLIAVGGMSTLAIGASTGGPKAVMSLLKTLPADFAGAVFVVQHIASGFAKGFVQWLDRESSIKVRLAVDGDTPCPGVALVAPNDYHMVLNKGVVRLLDSPMVNCCRPSIDVFFNSLAAEAGAGSLAVLLTGMGKDGAEGLRRIKECGGVTIAQDEDSSIVFGMPKAAIALKAVDRVLPLALMPAAISKIFAR